MIIFNNTCFSLQTYDFTSDDLVDLGEIGRGNYGTVNKMKHKKSDTIMSVKVRQKASMSHCYI